jgi:hypothetical protein
LFARITNGVAVQEFEPNDLFTVAAIGDAGETLLTFDLAQVLEAQRAKRRARVKK